jgi:hypothetical protein
MLGVEQRFSCMQQNDGIFPCMATVGLPCTRHTAFCAKQLYAAAELMYFIVQSLCGIMIRTQHECCSHVMLQLMGLDSTC